MNEPRFFRTAALKVIGFSAGVQYVLNLESLSLVGEIAVQGVLLVSVAMAAYTSRSDDRDTARLARFFRGVVIAAGLGLLTYSILSTVSRASDLDADHLLRQHVLPIWLTLSLLPFIYGLALFTCYRSAFRRMRIASRGVSTWRARVALGLKARLRMSSLQRADLAKLRDMALAPSVRDALKRYEGPAAQDSWSPRAS